MDNVLDSLPTHHVSILTKPRSSSAKCIDKYIALSTAHGEDAGKPIDPRLTDVVERMFQRCFDDGEYKQVGSSEAKTYSQNVY